MRRAARFASEGDFQRARAAHLKAWRAQPWRAEPLYEIARQYRREGRSELGYLFARRAVEIPLPQLDSSSIDADVYVWRAIDELALCALQTGRYEEGFELTSQLLEARSL